MKVVQESNQGSTESFVTLTGPDGSQISRRRDDPMLDQLVSQGYVVRPMNPLDSMTFGLTSNMALGQGMGQDVDPVLLKTIMDANPSLNRQQAEQAIREQNLQLTDG